MSIRVFEDEGYKPEWFEPVSFVVTDLDDQPQAATMAFGLKAQYDIIVANGLEADLRESALKISTKTNLPFIDCIPFAVCEIVQMAKKAV